MVKPWKGEKTYKMIFYQSRAFNMKLLIFLIYIIAPLVASARVSNVDDISRVDCKNGEIRSKDGQYCCPRPVNQEHTKYTCTATNPSCWVICEPGYSFPDSQSGAQTIECVEGYWMTNGRFFSGSLCERTVLRNESLDDQEHNSTIASPDTTVGDDNDRNGRAMGGFDEADMNGLDDEGPSTCGPMPMIRNAILKCSVEGDDDTVICVATCIRDHVLPNGKPSIEFIYEDRMWKIKGSDQPVESIQSCFRAMSPSEPDFYPPDFLVTDDNTSRVPGGCKGIPVPPEDTIGLIKVSRKKLGTCTNQEPLEGMVSCDGQCWSRATYQPTEVGLKFTSSSCLCCQAVQGDKTAVELSCEKRAGTFKMKFYIPTSCHCGPCTENQVITTTEEPIENVEGCPENHCD